MASPYKLTVELTPPQLENFYNSGSSITIAKASPGGGEPNVVWQALRPNKLLIMSWEEQYGMYATETRLNAGAKIDSFSSTEGSAIKGKGYTLRPSGVIFGPEGEKGPGSYYLKNQFSKQNESIGIGLYQQAELPSGPLPGNPVSYALTPLGSEAAMTPFTTLYVWLQSEVQGGSVVTQVTNPKTPVKFGGESTAQTLIYNSAEGLFQLKGGGKQVEDGLELETFVPVYF